jgi:hypothetical protein
VWIEADVDSRDLLEVFDSHDGVKLRPGGRRDRVSL